VRNLVKEFDTTSFYLKSLVLRGTAFPCRSVLYACIRLSGDLPSVKENDRAEYHGRSKNGDH